MSKGRRGQQMVFQDPLNTERYNWKGGWSFFFVAEAKDLHAAHHDRAIIFLVTAKQTPISSNVLAEANASHTPHNAKYPQGR